MLDSDNEMKKEWVSPLDDAARERSRVTRGAGAKAKALCIEGKATAADIRSWILRGYEGVELSDKTKALLEEFLRTGKWDGKFNDKKVRKSAKTMSNRRLTNVLKKDNISENTKQQIAMDRAIQKFNEMSDSDEKLAMSEEDLYSLFQYGVAGVELNPKSKEKLATMFAEKLVARAFKTREQEKEEAAAYTPNYVVQKTDKIPFDENGVFCGTALDLMGYVGTALDHQMAQMDQESDEEWAKECIERRVRYQTMSGVVDDSRLGLKKRGNDEDDGPNSMVG